ncbi:hypothetical protein [Micromonospora craniellae]|uniref:BON domain-containing protein n=1 Tax=Micromonospora craniellae TaxID=2294034 RepID=A0A372FS28_9ACTN|nr:hypothetical protein [Micromonospora craniellae]QOC91597.1 hypothetical protein ID554_27235 [Micromonospora craniellae]RFS43523.1 hypothetical protein D0Q02_27215 [Micromonospora craniellae]
MAERRLRTGLAFVLGMTMLSGCAVDKGSALAADFEADWAGTPDVASVQANAENTLPFFGSTTGTLTVQEGTSADRVSELAGELRQYVAGRDDVSGKINAADITFAVVPDGARNDEVVSLWRSMSTDSQVTSAHISRPSRGDIDRWRIVGAAPDVVGAMELFDDLTTGGGRHGTLTGVTTVLISTDRTVEPAVSVETGADGAVPVEAIAAFRAVVGRYPMVRATLRVDRVSIVLTRPEDRVAAEEVARALAPNIGTVEVTSQNR